MSTISIDAEKALRFGQERAVKALFKQFLVTLEDLEQEHNTSLQKLYDSLPEQYKPFVILADCLDEGKATLLRKKVLDAGNDCLRSVSDLVNQFNVTVK